ncbi:amino acid/polyamine/organocation transporter (APC superfamily) [Nonomuraea fuscirosea]|uniref:Amino acid/polyamine/organocation transporter (APC superfamily) n=1 Tax=Nonomuraea fuscirosea TaxID=1291556 RepID=A0A2T0N971_9ACTN|nr:APC family permease [Nonomuraea fuscirosea]PRX69334.1 amino acid/polyamine/organocation transporter (APC superfamily) [Nonomuraea fuscirosea]
MSTIEQFGYRQELKRTLGFADLMIYGLIFMVPIAPFGIFGYVFSTSHGMVALAYVIGLLAMAFTALSYAQMARAFPMAGSVYTYAGRGIAAPVGFMAGWAILLDYVLVPSLLYLIASGAMHSFVPAIPVWAWLVMFVLLNTGINYLGIQMTARITRVMLVAELAVLAIFLVAGVVALAQGKGQAGAFSPIFESSSFTWSVMFAAASVAVLSFLGFDGISTLAEENREDARRLGRSMLAALGVAAVLFVVQTWVAALLTPGRDKLIAEGDLTGNAFYDTAAFAGGQWLAVLTAVATAIAWGFANSLVAQAATSRLLFAMARDRQLPRFLAKVDPKRQVPVNATFAVAGISLAVGLFMSTREQGAGELTSLVNFGAMTAFLLLHVAVVVHYAIRQGSRDYWAHLVAPVIGFGILVAVVINQNVAAQWVGGIWLALGLVVLGLSYLSGRGPVLPKEVK